MKPIPSRLQMVLNVISHNTKLEMLSTWRQ